MSSWKLPEEYYKKAWIPLTEFTDPDKDFPNMDKIGGKPFLSPGEELPEDFYFVIQLTIPNECKDYGLFVPEKTVRIFICYCIEEINSEKIHISLIDYNDPFQESPKIPEPKSSCSGPIRLRKVTGWTTIDEYSQRAYDMVDDLKENKDVLMLEELSSKFKIGVTEILETIEKTYKFGGIKYGGNPSSCQSVGEYYLKDGLYLQIGEGENCDWYYGDGGEVHIGLKQIDGEYPMDGDCC